MVVLEPHRLLVAAALLALAVAAAALGVVRLEPAVPAAVAMVQRHQEARQQAGLELLIPAVAVAEEAQIRREILGRVAAQAAPASSSSNTKPLQLRPLPLSPRRSG
jgi:hypothetical protein